MSTSAMLRLNNVSLSFSGVDHAVLSEINYSINQGDFIIVLGSNGSGKSSLLKLLHRIHEPDSGQILFENSPLKKIPAKKFSHKIKMLTQNTHESLFVSLTVMENYLIVKQSYKSSLFAMNVRDERKFFSAYIEKFNEKLAAKLDQIVEQLSGGEKQALALALTVLNPPEILLLDEHTSALDPLSANKLMQITRDTIIAAKITCLLTTHDLSIAQEYGNRILALKHGEIHQVIERAEDTELTQQTLLAACY
jgi:putative ABC transport system ATP-binding protein